MDALMITFLFVMIIVIVFVIAFALIIKYGRKGKELCSIQNRDVNSYRQELIKKLMDNGYEIKEKPNGHIFVKKIHFQQQLYFLNKTGRMLIFYTFIAIHQVY